MPVQSEAALENGLIDTLKKMNYEYVHLEEENNLSANFKKQLEKHNKKKLEELGRTEFTDSEFEKILIYLEGGSGFEKAKTQNKLRPQHIKKIVDTYRERKEIEKYSHLATLQEVAENDYNLNIPRYVDTFEEEEPIDIHAVMKEIKELEAKRADLDKEIEGYLKELGLA